LQWGREEFSKEIYFSQFFLLRFTILPSGVSLDVEFMTDSTCTMHRLGFPVRDMDIQGTQRHKHNLHTHPEATSSTAQAALSH
jgi:hypothetical protein